MKTSLMNLNKIFWIGISLNIVGTFGSLIVPIILKNFIDASKISLSSFNSEKIFLLLLILIIKTICTSYGDYLISREGDKKITDIRLKIQKHLLSIPTSFFDDNLSSELTSRVINDAGIIKGFLTTVVPNAITGLLTLVGSLCFLVILDWKLTVIILFIFPIDALFTVPIGKITEKISEETQTSISELSGVTTEGFRNIRTVKLNNAEKNIFKFFENRINKLLRLSIKADIIYSITTPIQGLISFALIVGVVVYGSVRVSKGMITIGTLTSFLIYLFQIIQPINTIADFYSDFKQVKGATRKINYILNLKSEANEKNLVEIGDIKPPYRLEFKNVKFAYNEKVILEKLNLKFEQGKKIAIVGATGSGKSTILNILTRLYDPDEGVITINDCNANLIDLNEWRYLFGVVSQENTVLTGTIKDNLIFGLDEIPSEKQIDKAIQIANLKKEIEELKNGLNTVVGEQGIKLSGGQRQRIQIARAYLKNATFLILDEATSSLDSDSERKISDALNIIMEGKTIIAIAHRLSTIVDADMIYFIKDKTVKACGTHLELLKILPEYKKFVEEQLIKIE